ncbi:hypothetical protein PA25_37750 [Pseudoalteromonas sp. A25]|nr:hypothetical protein PA25_37750 [Pseudoalteromonas sp. A25]
MGVTSFHKLFGAFTVVDKATMLINHSMVIDSTLVTLLCNLLAIDVAKAFFWISLKLGKLIGSNA